jgi:hypothetical protein
MSLGMYLKVVIIECPHDYFMALNYVMNVGSEERRTNSSGQGIV